MDGEIYSITDLEKLKNWKATFRIILCLASPTDRLTCLLRYQDGFIWKQPGRGYIEPVTLDKVKELLKKDKIQLVRGKIPRPPNKKKDIMITPPSTNGQVAAECA